MSDMMNMARVTVRLSEADRDYAQELGRGSVTNGIRWLIEEERVRRHRREIARRAQQGVGR